MKPDTFPVSELMRVHYGSALKEADRVQSGDFDVYGSSGPVGRHDRALFQSPSIIIGRKGSVGAITFAPRPGWAIDTAFYAEVIDRKRNDLRYLYYALRAANLQQHTITTSIPGLSRDDIYRTRVWAPALTEQRRIADILDKADAIRRKRKEAIALTEELLRSAFLEMFGDPVTNPNKWPLVPLSRLGAITTGNTPSRAVPEYFGDHVEWIKSDNINTPRHYLTRATEGLSQKGRDVGRTVPAGSSLVTCIAGSPECIGNVALADREVAFNQQINAVTPKPGVDHRFLYVLLLVGKRLVQSASTNSMKGMVSKGKLEQVPFPSPDPPLQERFGHVFDRVLTLSRRLELSAAGSDELFDSTVARAFRGELTSPIGASSRVAAGSQ